MSKLQNKIIYIVLVFLLISCNNTKKAYNEGVISKYIIISAENEINNNLAELFKNTHPINGNNANSTIIPWDSSIYLKKINDADDFYCFYFRPPYSNNTMPCIYDNVFYSYDLKNNAFTIIDDTAYLWLFADSDRGSTLYYIYSPEWTLSNVNGNFLFLINKNHEEIFSGNEKKIIEYLLNDFKNTIFDNEYIIETISQISNNNIGFQEIITRYGMSLFHGTFTDNKGDKDLSKKYYHGSNSFFYLLNRLNKYFDVNVSFYNEYDNKFELLHAQIYNNGFYFYSPSRAVFFDLSTRQAVEYKFDKNLLELTKSNSFWIHTSEDNSKFYISVRDNKDFKIFEYYF